jgi:hypothetical protein
MAGCGNNDGLTHTHEWGEWTVTRAANCSETGVKTRVCMLDETHIETEVIPIDPNVHVWGALTEGTPPTCTTAGNGTRICTLNPAHTETGTIPINPNAHNWGNYEQTTPPTCTEPGIDTATCTHNPSHTTTREGAAAPEHDYQNWEQTTAPTCTEPGIETGTCTHDPSHTTTREGAAALDHDWGEWEAAISYIANEETRTCKRDPSHFETRPGSTPALPITNTDEWNTALTQLNGRTGEYTLTISGYIGVTGLTSVDGVTASTLGTTPDGSSLIVTLQGSGTLSLTSSGSLIRILANQTLIIDSEGLILEWSDPTWSTNNTSLVYIGGRGTVELKNGTITGNRAHSSSANCNGGGVYVGSGGFFTMSGGKISNNRASANYGNGGGVYVGSSYVTGVGDVYGTFTMSGGEISGNTAYGSGGVGYGGGVYLNANARFNMSGGTISGNTASGNTTGYGGGVYVSNRAYFTIYDGTINGNIVSGRADGYGGGICLDYNDSSYRGFLSIANVTISGNTAQGFYSAVYWCTTSTVYANGFAVEGDTSVSTSYINVTSRDSFTVVNGVMQ